MTTLDQLLHIRAGERDAKRGTSLQLQIRVGEKNGRGTKDEPCDIMTGGERRGLLERTGENRIWFPRLVATGSWIGFGAFR